MVPLPAPSDPVTGDLAADALALLAEGEVAGVPGALVTLTEADGGPRAVGAHMAVLADGRWRGHLSGGCVEQAVAAEALDALAAGESRALRLGTGSPLLDIRLPCGSGLTLWIGVEPPAGLGRVGAGRAGGAPGDDARGSHTIGPSMRRWCQPAGAPMRSTGSTARPLRLLILGSGPEALATAALAHAAGDCTPTCSPPAPSWRGARRRPDWRWRR